MDEPPLRRRVHLGLELDEVPGKGLGVSAVAPRSTAALAGIEPGDLLVEIAGTPVRSADPLFAAVREVQVGSVVSLTVERGGTRHTLEGPAAPLPLERLPSGRIELDEITTASGRRRVIRSVPEGEGPFDVVYLLQGASWSSCEFPLDPATPLLELVSGLTASGLATERV